MEQLIESRVKFNEPLMITAIQNDETTCAGRFVDFSSDSMRIRSNADLEIGSLQRLEVGDDLMMTEVRDCEPDKGEFSAGLLILAWVEKSELKRLVHETLTFPAERR